MSLTPAQLGAVNAQGDVLVVAGAGAGKTKTLVERCLDRILSERERISLDRMLVVTFTEAAATEVKRRIRERLLQAVEEQPNAWVEEQLALLERAYVSTLHGFCYSLIREHFHELALDPEVAVLEEGQALLLRQEVFSDVLEHKIGDPGPGGQALRAAALGQAEGQESLLQSLVFRIHEQSQIRPDPRRWLEHQKNLFASAGPERWEQWLGLCFEQWRKALLPALEREKSPFAAAALAILSPQSGTLSRDHLELCLRRVEQCAEQHKSRKDSWFKPFEQAFDFLCSFRRVPSAEDPLGEDWRLGAPQMLPLLELAEEFERAYLARKREQAALDFHDLEQFALQLLWDTALDRPKPLAESWRRQFRCLFVDEYQDINPAQNAILTALAGELQNANRFLVGDVKQSIYRFRLADPRIFRNYESQWKKAPHATVHYLAENFRSRELIIDFINALFRCCMTSELGEVAYSSESELKFGARDVRSPLTRQNDSRAKVQIHLLVRSGEKEQADDPAESALADLSAVEQEAAFICAKLRELHESKFPVWDDALKTFRPVQWKDMAILLRSPSGRVHVYAKEFARRKIPFSAPNVDFFDSIEVSDLVNLLNLLDNPMQDLPLVAVLRSPMVQLSLDDLAEVRAAAKKERFWTALQIWHNGQSSKEHGSSAFQKVTRFLECFGRWRRSGRELSLSQRLEQILAETHYAEWLSCQSRAAQRQANLRKLVRLARRFDQFHRQGLYRFIQFLAAQKEIAAETQGPAGAVSDAVHFSSIHRSKGLEFPVVVLGDAGKKFNFRSLNERVIVDEVYGLCPSIKAPSGQSYPSLPLWMARRRQREETLAEEIRLLYVALTRARDHLLIVGSCAPKAVEEGWLEKAQGFELPQTKLSAMSLLDWIGPWLIHQIGSAPWRENNEHETELFHCSLRRVPAAPAAANRLDSTETDGLASVDAAVFDDCMRRLDWTYPHRAATRQPAKASLSSLRRQMREEEVAALGPVQPRFSSRNLSKSSNAAQLSAKVGPSPEEIEPVEIGLAHHRLLQLASWDALPHETSLGAEADQLLKTGWLTAVQRSALNLSDLCEFWRSDVGKLLLQNRACLKRELPFTARFTPAELTKLGLRGAKEESCDEFIVVQGVADLVALFPDQIWLLDFKTDSVSAKEVKERIHEHSAQLGLYTAALAKIFGQPVTRRWLRFLRLGMTVSVED